MKKGRTTMVQSSCRCCARMGSIILIGILIVVPFFAHGFVIQHSTTIVGGRPFGAIATTTTSTTRQQQEYHHHEEKEENDDNDKEEKIRLALYEMGSSDHKSSLSINLDKNTNNLTTTIPSFLNHDAPFPWETYHELFGPPEGKSTIITKREEERQAKLRYNQLLLQKLQQRKQQQSMEVENTTTHNNNNTMGLNQINDEQQQKKKSPTLSVAAEDGKTFVRIAIPTVADLHFQKRYNEVFNNIHQKPTSLQQDNTSTSSLQQQQQQENNVYFPSHFLAHLLDLPKSTTTCMMMKCKSLSTLSMETLLERCKHLCIMFNIAHQPKRLGPICKRCPQLLTYHHDTLHAKFEHFFLDNHQRQQQQQQQQQQEPFQEYYNVKKNKNNYNNNNDDDDNINMNDDNDYTLVQLLGGPANVLSILERVPNLLTFDPKHLMHHVYELETNVLGIKSTKTTQKDDNQEQHYDNDFIVKKKKNQKTTTNDQEDDTMAIMRHVLKRCPEILQNRPSTLKEKIQDIQTIMKVDLKTAQNMMIREPRLSCYSGQLLQIKLHAWSSRCNTNMTQQLAHYPSLFLYGLGGTARLEYFMLTSRDGKWPMPLQVQSLLLIPTTVVETWGQPDNINAKNKKNGKNYRILQGLPPLKRGRPTKQQLLKEQDDNNKNVTTTTINKNKVPYKVWLRRRVEQQLLSLKTKDAASTLSPKLTVGQLERMFGANLKTMYKSKGTVSGE